MKTYRGIPGEVPKVTVEQDGAPARLLRAHTPGVGFGWGDAKATAGRQPATNLAMTIAVHVLGDEQLALRYHLRLKHRTITTFNRDAAWALTDQEVLQHVQNIREVEAATAQTRRMVSLEPPPVAMEGGLGVGGRTIEWDPKTPRIPQPKEQPK